MRFFNGSKVEILSKQEVSFRCWVCAEIISGNGHTYSVKYDWLPVTGEPVVERVPRKVIRPCPPSVEGLENWVPGDLVEVLHNLSWKIATIEKVLVCNSFLVRLLGSSREFRAVHRDHLRVPLSWQDENWFVIEKDTGNCTTSARKVQSVVDDHFPVEGNNENGTTSVRTLKRRSLVGSRTHVEAYDVDHVQKKKAIEKDGSPQRMCPASFPSLEILGENYMHASRVTTRFPETDDDVGSRKPNGFNDRILAATPTRNDCTDSTASSVGSCSVTTANVLHSCSIKHRSDEDIESHCSDAESFCGRPGYEEEGCSIPTSEKKKLRWRISVKHSTFQIMYI